MGVVPHHFIGFPILICMYIRWHVSNSPFFITPLTGGNAVQIFPGAIFGHAEKSIEKQGIPENRARAPNRRNRAYANGLDALQILEHLFREPKLQVVSARFGAYLEFRNVQIAYQHWTYKL